MKAWTKRVIWFFGVSLLNSLDTFISYYGGKAYAPSTTAEALSFALLLLVPLFFFKDDNKKRK